MRIIKLNEVLTIWEKYARYSFDKRVKYIWKDAWLRNASITFLIVMTPIFTATYTLEEMFRDKSKLIGTKYGLEYRIYRPDHPMVARLQHTSYLD